MKCIILAAGYATRLYPLTENFPKPLLEVKGKSIMNWLIEDIEKIDLINQIIVVSNHKFIKQFEKWKKDLKGQGLYKKNLKIEIIDDGSTNNENRFRSS